MDSSDQGEALKLGFLRPARKMMGRDPDGGGSAKIEDKRFRELFGCGMQVVLTLWGLLLENDSMDGLECKHLLWTLLFLKVYSKEASLCSIAGGVDEKTFRKWVWGTIYNISCLEFLVIIWEDRFIRDVGNDALVTVDGTDFRIPELGKKFYSHKYKKSGVRYEVGLCIRTGDIVWVHGPFPCGEYNDITIFRHAMMGLLEEGERVEADDGYIGEAPGKVKCPKCVSNPSQNRKKQQRVRARHETVNKRFKQWGCLIQVFRHDIVAQHADVFRAVAVITQLCINAGERLFDVEYDDDTPVVPPFS